MAVRYSDKLFKKIFMGLVTFAVMLTFVLAVHLFFSVPINSKPLWIGSLLTYLVINLIIDLTGLINRIVILIVGIVLLTIFFIAIINWPIVPSLLTGMIIMVMSGLLYITFLH
jgi:hypothetical protein